MNDQYPTLFNKESEEDNEEGEESGDNEQRRRTDYSAEQTFGFHQK